MENFNQPIDDELLSGVNLTPKALDDLRSTGGWAMFIAIVGLLFSGLMILAGLMVLIFAFIDDNLIGTTPNAIFFLMSFFYLAMGVLYLIPMILLLRFSNNARRVGQGQNSIAIEGAFSNLRKHYKMLGIMVIAMILLYILMIVIYGMFLGAMMSSF